MKHTMKHVALLLALAMLLCAVCACVPSPSEVSSGSDNKPADSNTTDAGTTEPADNSGKKELQVWYSVSGTSGETFVRLAEEYNAAHDEIEVVTSYSGTANDTATKVSAALMTGTQPAVAMMHAGPLYTGGRDVYELQSYLEAADFDMDDVFDGMWQYCKFGTNEQVCALPFGISTQVMYYNADILKAADIDMTNPPKTWDEFLEVALEAQAKGNINNVADFYGFDVTDAPWLFKSMLMQNGCSVVQADATGIHPSFNAPEGVEVAEFWKKMIDSGVMAPGEHSNAENKFLAGNLAFLAMSSNRISRWTDLEFELGAIEMPYFDTPSLALGGTTLVVLTEDESLKQAAYDFAMYMASAEVQAEFALSTGYLPIHKSALEMDSVKAAIEENQLYNVAFNQLNYTWSYIHFEQMGTMDLLLGDNLEMLEKNKKTAEEMLNQTYDELNVEMED